MYLHDDKLKLNIHFNLQDLRQQQTYKSYSRQNSLYYSQIESSEDLDL